MKTILYELILTRGSPGPILKSQSKRTVKHENPEKFDAFVNAAEAA
jgi:hypothetical protein